MKGSTAKRPRGEARFHLIMQNHIQQRLVYSDFAVVFNETQLAKAVHEEVDTRAGSAHHLGQSLLRNLWNQGFGFPWFAEFRHQQKNSGQTLFARVEKLIDKICL